MRWMRWASRLKRRWIKGEDTKPHTIPQHVAIIMDGNGRWATLRGMPRIAGHHAGMKNVRDIALAANDMGIHILTLYAFSTENWRRPKDEVEFLMGLPEEFLHIYLDELAEKNVQVRWMGKSNGLPPHTRRAVDEAAEKTAQNTGLILNFALNYGGRHELVQAARKLAEKVARGTLKSEDIDEARFSEELYTADLPDPDLLIRTSGEMRLSNFLLWQLAYTELIFVERYWPDFTPEDLKQAILTYQTRKRRFGAL
ncbi:MAG: isoprenyl transferase [Candidatus Carbobacillus altaicus]|nr:isoprenyl transferase [Candidatus Carbobacillus altaicus]